MGLPWFRVDSDFYHHDKVVWLKAQRGGWKALGVYLGSIGWSVSHETNGHIPEHMAKYLDADKSTVTLLLGARMWEPNGNGWHIRNFDNRQQTVATSDQRIAALTSASVKGNCIRWHGPDCGCWKDQK